MSELASLKTIPLRYNLLSHHKEMLIKYTIPSIYALWEGFVKNSFESVFVWKVTQISSSFPPNCSSYFEHNAFNNSGVADKYQKVSAGFTCPK